MAYSTSSVAPAATPAPTSTPTPALKPAPEITISPFYNSAVNEIIQPEKYAAHSHYLTRRWKRELGPTGYAILTSLRDRCFYNRKTGERRDSIQLTMQDIADECGISERTVRRELNTNKTLQLFVRPQREYEPDTRRGGFRYGANSFQVAMDDPLHPQDEAQLIEIMHRKADDAEKNQTASGTSSSALDRARQRTAAAQAPTSGQIVRTQPLRSDNLSQRSDNLSQRPVKLTGRPGQIDRTLNPDSSLPKNTSPDFSEGSASLFPEEAPGEEQPPKQAQELAPPPSSEHLSWERLSETERAPWLSQARQELVAIHAGSGITPRPKLIEVRGRNLYQAAQTAFARSPVPSA